MVDVTQADKDAVAVYWSFQTHDLSQAFAAHRTAERERCIAIMRAHFPGYENAQDEIERLLRDEK